MQGFLLPGSFGTSRKAENSKPGGEAIVSVAEGVRCEQWSEFFKEVSDIFPQDDEDTANEEEEGSDGGGGGEEERGGSPADC